MCSSREPRAEQWIEDTEKSNMRRNFLQEDLEQSGSSSQGTASSVWSDDETVCWGHWWGTFPMVGAFGGVFKILPTTRPLEIRI